MDWILLIAAIALSFACVAIGIRPLRRFLIHRAILDLPNFRSSHTEPTPKGAGLVLVPTVLVMWVSASFLGLGGVPIEIVAPVGIASIVLLFSSWLDDLHDLHVGIRLLIHASAAGVGLLSLPVDSLVFQGLLPPFADRLATVVLWMWFINLFNFMDGIDGISGVETVLICGGLIAISTLLPAVSELTVSAAVLLGATCGFLMWNWHPARIFLGDAGSAPLGFMLGWLLFSLAAHGAWMAALILPAYYLADSGITLAKRVLRKERFWQAHKQHYYQQAVQRGMTHGRVSIVVFLSGLVLGGLSLLSLGDYREISIFAALLTVWIVVRYFSGRSVLFLRR